MLSSDALAAMGDCKLLQKVYGIHAKSLWEVCNVSYTKWTRCKLPGSLTARQSGQIFIKRLAAKQFSLQSESPPDSV